jgi:4-hydroxy-3-polyprenylbenzoate decarboxylase
MLGLDPSTMAPGPQSPGDFVLEPLQSMNFGLLVDATRKWDYPPTALPKQEYMEAAKKIWEELNLPKLTPKVPWFGYNLGQWSKENEEEAALALKGQHHQTGKKLATRGQKI